MLFQADYGPGPARPFVSQRNRAVARVAAAALRDFVPGRDEESPSAAHSAQSFIVVELEVSVHNHRIDHERANEIFVSVAAAVHSGVGVGRDEDAGELAVAVEGEVRHGRSCIGHEVGRITRFVQDPIATDGETGAARVKLEAATAINGHLVVNKTGY